MNPFQVNLIAGSKLGDNISEERALVLKADVEEACKSAKEFDMLRVATRNCENVNETYICTSFIAKQVEAMRNDPIVQLMNLINKD